MERHTYRKIIFPGFREYLFVAGHRGRGHKLVHCRTPHGCYWSCDCTRKHWC